MSDLSCREQTLQLVPHEWRRRWTEDLRTMVVTIGLTCVGRPTLEVIVEYWRKDGARAREAEVEALLPYADYKPLLPCARTLGCFEVGQDVMCYTSDTYQISQDGAFYRATVAKIPGRRTDNPRVGVVFFSKVSWGFSEMRLGGWGAKFDLRDPRIIPTLNFPLLASSSHCAQLWAGSAGIESGWLRPTW